MKTVYISIPDMNDSFSRIVILGVEYLIRFTYNDTYDFWSFGLFTSNKEPIFQNVMIVPNFPLNLFVGVNKMPYVYFACKSNLEHIGRNDFSSNAARFYYVER